MVRAAASGLVDYTRADPKDIYWKLRHRMLIYEMERQEEFKLLDVVHRHWLTYVLKTNLTKESADNVKANTIETLQALQNTIFPWRAADKAGGQRDTINNDAQNLVEQYKQFQETLKQQNQANA